MAIAREAFDSASNYITPPLEVRASVYAHNDKNRKRGLLIPIEVSYELIEHRVRAAAEMMGWSKRKAICEALVTVEEGTPYFVFGYPSRFIYAENWPISIFISQDRKLLKISERGGPVDCREFEAYEAEAAKCEEGRQRARQFLELERSAI